MPVCMIDTHCHILPNMDDGPMDFDESLEMAKIASGDGICKIIATPHVNDSQYTFGHIVRQVDHLNRLLKQNDIPLTVYPGAEVSIGLDPARIPQYTLNNTKYCLIEFPHNHLPSFAGRILDWLVSKGLKPIIAHPERNYTVIRSPELLLDLLNKNVYVQITAGSLTGDFGVDIQYCANYLLDSGRVDMIASDAHSKKFRSPVLSEAAETAATLVGREASQCLVSANPAAILTGEEIH